MKLFLHELSKSVIALSAVFILAGCCSLRHCHNEGKDGRAIVCEAIRDGIDVNQKLPDGSTLLSLAMAQGSPELVRLLLENGADANIKPADEEPVLIKAVCQYNNANVLYDHITGNPLPFYVMHCYEIVRLLLENGANVNAADKFGRTALYEAASPEMIRLLLRYGADVNLKKKDGTSILKDQHFFELTKMLIEAGADIRDFEHQDSTPLIRAAILNDVVTAEKISNVDDLINKKDADGWSPLMFASALDNENMVKYLISKNADDNCSTKGGYTSLKLAVSTGSCKIVKLLLENGAKVNVEGDSAYWGDSELFLALRTNLPDINTYMIMDLLLKFGVNINSMSGYGSTVLTDSINLSPLYTDYLCQKGADINKINSFGNTALIEAASKGKIEHLRILLRFKASVNIINNKTSDLMTALDFANLRLKEIQNIRSQPRMSHERFLLELEDKNRKLLEANMVILLLREQGAKTATELKAEKTVPAPKDGK